MVAQIDVDKHTDYILDGNPILAGNKTGRPPAFPRNPEYFPLAIKMNVATKYAVYGDVDEVARQSNVPAKYIREWKEEPWWAEVQKKMFVEQNEKLASTISSVLDETLAHLSNRLVEGDEIYDQKRGQFLKQQVSSKTLSALFTTLSQQRRLTRGEPTSITTATSTTDRLKGLEDAFKRFVSAKEITGDLIDAKEI